MKHLKTYIEYLKESLDGIEMPYKIYLKESIGAELESLLNVLDTEKIDFYTFFDVTKDDISEDADIDILVKNKHFLQALRDKFLKKTNVENSDDYETFLKSPIRFFFLYDKNKNNIENPDYIIVQEFDKNMKVWIPFKMYIIKDSMNKFYDKLTSKTIEIKTGNDTYIYNTTNSGNNWQLQNTELENDKFKKMMSSEELESLLGTDTTVKIIY
jgi:hypothetical protein